MAVALSGVLIAGFVVFEPALAQPRNLDVTVGVDDPGKLCQSAQAADEEERVLATKRKSPALNAALRSESAFWTFLIDPSTAYLDRMAAALHGGNLVSPEQLPRLWETYAIFETLPHGVSPSPCEFMFNASPAGGSG